MARPLVFEREVIARRVASWQKSGIQYLFWSPKQKRLPKGAAEYLEAQAGIEPTYTDLQSAA